MSPESSSSSRPTTRSSSPTPSTRSRSRSPFPPTLRLSSNRKHSSKSPSPSVATTGSPQRLTATAVPARMHLAPHEAGTASSTSSVVGVGFAMSEVSAEEALMREGGMETETEGESDSGTERETETEGEGDGVKDVVVSAVAVEGHIAEPVGDEEGRRALRDQLKRTLSQRRHESNTVTDVTVQSALLMLSPGVNNNNNIPTDINNADASFDENVVERRQYFVLTDAGKPVFVSEGSPLSSDPDALASTIGLMQALISVFIDDGDKLRSINAGRTRITFLLRTPLYYACVSSWGEPESVTRSHLEYLHLQILSVVSGAQLRKIFERRTNFDLRRLLTGAETFLHSLLARMQTDLAMSTSSLLCLALDPKLRRKIGEALIPTKMKDILYVMLIARGRVVTLVRPKKHSVHPADLHILLNTIHAPAIADSPASWLPVCLPKFNPSGFLHVYVSFPQQTAPIVLAAQQPQAQEAQTPATEEVSLPLGLGLVCVSGGGGGEFENIRSWCEEVTKNLETSGTLDTLERSIRRGHSKYDVSVLGVPGLRHFVYKSRPHVQVTHPEWGEEYADPEARRRLITLYQILHDGIHGKSGQKETLKLQYIRTRQESVMGWITQPFELYIAVSSELSKMAVVGAANAVVRWVKREEPRLFLRDAPVF